MPLRLRHRRSYQLAGQAPLRPASTGRQGEWAIKDFPAFVTKLMKINVLAPVLAVTDPSSYWVSPEYQSGHFEAALSVFEHFRNT